MKPTLRLRDDQNSWNFLLALFFILVLAGALCLLWNTLGSFPRAIPLFDMILLALASFRITRLMVYDKITRWFRELFVAKKYIEKDGQRWVELHPYGQGLRHSLYDLLGCPWCIGFWSALIVTVAYYIFPWAWVLILFLAVAGLGSFVQITANFIGWKAENEKLDALSKE